MLMLMVVPLNEGFGFANVQTEVGFDGVLAVIGVCKLNVAGCAADRLTPEVNATATGMS